MSIPERDVDVLVVGGGPTGLTAANLLGTLGISVLLVEQNASTSDEAKAISLDDESLRSLQLADLDRAVYEIIVPGTGTRYFGTRSQLLVHARGDANLRFGHPSKNAFPQPELERTLRHGLDRFSGVRQRFSTCAESIEQHPDHVEVQLRGVDDDSRETIRAAYVLACDGGRSTIRQLLGITMSGRSFDEVWLVVDALNDPHDQRYGMHHGDPERPHVIIPGRNGRCRYEFALRPGEGAAGEPPPFELVRDLLGRYRSVEPCDIERAINYRFNALLADTFRDHRCLVLGDAAHMMPPFAGQGLNSGVRDATNVCWKVASVLKGDASDALLDTYETERRPHAQAMIDLSVRLGKIVMTTDRRRAWLRDALVSAANRTRRGRRYFTEMRYRPATRFAAGAVVHLEDQPLHALVGRVLPQPHVLHGSGHERVRLDDVLGNGWSLLGINVTDADWSAVHQAGLPRGTEVDVVLDDRQAPDAEGRRGVADADGTLQRLLGDGRGRFVLVRPDRVVATTFSALEAEQVVEQLRVVGLGATQVPSGPDHHRSS